MKRGITLYLHVHQPWRIREYSVFDSAHSHDYFSANDGTERDNRAVFEKVASKSYRPMNQLLLKLMKRHSDFKVSLSISGTFLEQAEVWAPDVIESFQELVATGQVELVAETYYHSLAFFYSQDEFERQVEQQQALFERMFGVRAKAFRNTELAYNDQLAVWADKAGFETILAEGWDPILQWRSPGFVYRPAGAENIRLLMKNYRLSDDLAFRFSDRNWSEWPLSSSTYLDWLEQAVSGNGSLINLFMDYETFGEHQWEDTGIFSFFESVVDGWLSRSEATFYTVSQASESSEPVGHISMPDTVTWADSERDLTAWLGNSMQQEILHHVYALEADILRTGDMDLISDWRRLQTSDHSYYLCTKWFSDGDVHAYFSPYSSPYDAFLYYLNAVRDLRYRIMEHTRFGGYL